ncbi:non-specific lipid transfer protein GPI-anchored 19-like [Dioscorea cayenensis subsp. rotundata]|uniref:Non-specific lipid transfer protein GPI-anchored 19-like n=1 Tax=Dioscorea cayennensis subsp. rotundata TaxID=55577 RepID=A0AB40CJU3_DIOCR|nr:non-specific lipid transfer protein GPI-anchored 19-like [Dioscorea cayenensis subsp. rotundata]
MASTLKQTSMIFTAAALVMFFFIHTSSAQSTSCTTAVISLAPCLSYITGNLTTPSSSCCSQLASVVQSQVQCLCTVLNGGASQFGIAINQTQALTLPSACKVQTPPISRCNGAAGGTPVAPPAASPAGTPTVPSNDSPATDNSPTTPSSTPSVPDSPSSGSGSKTTPTTKGQSTDASFAKMNQPLILGFMVLSAFVSPFFITF